MQHLHHELEDAFASLQHHVADEAVADDHIGHAALNVAALDVADEAVGERAGVEQRVRFLGQIVALGLLGADVHQADGRLSRLRMCLAKMVPMTPY